MFSFFSSQPAIVFCFLFSGNEGIALWDVVAANVINSQGEDSVIFFEAYSLFPPALHSIYLFLLSVVLVTTIDRCVAMETLYYHESSISPRKLPITMAVLSV